MMSDVDYRCTITLRYAALRAACGGEQFHPLEERPLVVRERQNEMGPAAGGTAAAAGLLGHMPPLRAVIERRGSGNKTKRERSPCARESWN